MASSQAQSRVWAPLGLLLVLACGAWFFPEQFPDQAPDAGPPVLELAKPAVPASPGVPGGVASAAAEGQHASIPAAQVLDAVSQTGRQAKPAASAPVSADALKARVRQDPALVHRQTAGQRLRVQGQLAAVEAGEPGVVVLHLALAGQPGTVRMVASPALAQSAAAWVPPRAVSLDCLSQGVMMGEWLLVDCQE